MVNYYKQKLILFKDGTELRAINIDFLAEDSDPRINGIERKPITWQDLPAFFQEHGLWMPFTIYKTKKGQKISYFDWFDGLSTREWKDSSTHLEYGATPAKLMKVSVKDILRCNDSELAIKYLVERGMNVLSK